MIFLITLLVGVVVAQGALLWLIASALAPAEKDFPLWRGLLLGAALSGWHRLYEILISPIISGMWGMVIAFGVAAAVVQLGFRLSILRSIAATALLWIAVFLWLHVNA
jgi:hypothetical protein